jgi:hypothetical protein
LSPKERLAITEAFQIANVTLLSIVEASTAGADTYAVEKLRLFEDNSKVVTFFNIGADHTWAAVFRITANITKDSPDVEELAMACRHTLGEI